MICTAMKLLLLICLIPLSLNVRAETRVLQLKPEKIASLDGEWKFYPSVLSNDFKNLKPLSVQLPNSFENLIGKKNTHGTFVQTFVIPKEAVGKILAFSVPYQYGAYELYIDDALILRTGQVGDQFHHQTKMAPKLRTYVPTKEIFKITLKVSSYSHIHGGLSNSILLGYDAYIRTNFYKSLIMTTWVSGMLIMISLFIVLFSVYRIIQGQKDYKLLFLGLFIFCFSLRSFFAVPFPYTLFSNISWLWGTRIEYLLTEFISLFFMTYLYLALPHLLNKTLYLLLSLVILINILVTLTQIPLVFQDFFFKSFALSLLLFANMIYGAYRIYCEKIPFSKINTAAILVVCSTFIHDYLLGLKLIESVEIAFYTSCLYFMIVTLNLSRDYAIKSEQAMRYNKKLIELNESLDAQVNDRTQDIKKLNEQLSLQLRSDALTGAYNRYALNQEIQSRFEYAKQQQESLAFLMIDVDYFKNYNDAYGHLRGDDVLRQLVHLMTEKISHTDFLARYGGEEFAIISDLNKKDISLLIETCLQHIREANITHAHRLDEKQHVTVSIGAAVMDDKRSYNDITELMKAADQQLYKAKIQRDCAKII